MWLSLLPEHGALHGGAVVGQGQRRPALPAGARRRQVAEEEVRHTLGQLRLLLECECDPLWSLHFNYCCHLWLWKDYIYYGRGGFAVPVWPAWR